MGNKIPFFSHEYFVEGIRIFQGLDHTLFGTNITCRDVGRVAVHPSTQAPLPDPFTK